NFRLQGLQAAILRVKLTRLEQWTEARRKLAAEYDRLLAPTGVTCPAVIPDARHVYCLYTIQSDERDNLQRELEIAGIKTAVHYPVPVPLTPAYSDERYRAGDFPAAEACARKVLSLPLYPHMTVDQVRQVAQAIDLSTKRNQYPLPARR